jgi:hypothetical protein
MLEKSTSCLEQIDLRSNNHSRHETSERCNSVALADSEHTCVDVGCCLLSVLFPENTENIFLYRLVFKRLCEFTYLRLPMRRKRLQLRNPYRCGNVFPITSQLTWLLLRDNIVKRIPKYAALR